MRDYVKNENDGKWYAIDSCWTWDHGYETMIFACILYPFPEGLTSRDCINFRDLYVEYYANESMMIERHKEIVKLLPQAHLYYYDDDQEDGYFDGEELGWV